MFQTFEYFTAKQLEEARENILKRKKVLENCKKTRSMDHLYSVVYQQSSYGFPPSGSIQNVKRLKREEIVEYFLLNYRPANMIFSVAGSVNLDRVYDTIQFSFPSVHYFNELDPVPTPKFYSSMVKDCDDTNDDLFITFAYEIVKPIRYVPILLHVDKLVGSYDCKNGKSDFSSPRLAEIVATENLCDSYETFLHLNYDAGLYGLSMKTKKDNARDLIELVTGEFIRMAFRMSETELGRASKAVAVSEVASDDNPVTLSHKMINNIILGPFLQASKHERLHVADTIGLEYVKLFMQDTFINCAPSISGVGNTTEFPELHQIMGWCTALR